MLSEISFRLCNHIWCNSKWGKIYCGCDLWRKFSLVSRLLIPCRLASFHWLSMVANLIQQLIWLIYRLLRYTVCSFLISPPERQRLPCKYGIVGEWSWGYLGNGEPAKRRNERLSAWYTCMKCQTSFSCILRTSWTVKAISAFALGRLPRERRQFTVVLSVDSERQQKWHNGTGKNTSCK